jgi:hypothetical protein
MPRKRVGAGKVKAYVVRKKRRDRQFPASRLKRFKQAFRKKG